MSKKFSFMDTPIGANMPFIVKMNGIPFAGFKSRHMAQIYIQVQMEKKNHNKNLEAFAAKQTWTIN